MKKIFRRLVAGICVVAMTVSTINIGGFSPSIGQAADNADGIQFGGEKNRYLQLGESLPTVPKTIETEIAIKDSAQECVLLPATGDLEQKFFTNYVDGTTNFIDKITERENGIIKENEIPAGESGPKVGTAYAETTILEGGKFAYQKWNVWSDSVIISDETMQCILHLSMWEMD